MSSFMLKHWSTQHPQEVRAPKFRFKVLKNHKDPMSRLVHEAILISDQATMNSKSEWGGYRMARLKVESAEWQVRKEVEEVEDQAKVVREGMIATRDRAKAHAKAVLATNDILTSRKRQAQTMSGNQAKRQSSQASKVLLKDAASDDLNRTMNLDSPTVATSEVKFGLSTKHGVCSWSSSAKKFVRESFSEPDNAKSEDPTSSPILAPLPVTPEENEVFVFVASTPAVANSEPVNAIEVKSSDDSVNETVSCEELATRSSDVEFLLKATENTVDSEDKLSSDGSNAVDLNEAMDQLCLPPSFVKFIEPYAIHSHWKTSPESRGVKRKRA